MDPERECVRVIALEVDRFAFAGRPANRQTLNLRDWRVVLEILLIVRTLLEVFDRATCDVERNHTKG